MQRLSSLIHNLVVHGAAKERMGMAYQRNEIAGARGGGGPEHRLEASCRAFEEKIAVKDLRHLIPLNDCMASENQINTDSRVSNLESRGRRGSEIRCATRGPMVASDLAPERGLMEDDVERRAARRFSMNLPVKVRFSSGEGVTERQGETRDVSFR